MKTDNHNLAAKLALRRHFMGRYHQSGARVFDACQGDGTIWSRLRQEFPLASYWGTDLKPQHGRIKIDSTRILNQPGWGFDVIDIDTYGMPWKHYEAALQFGGARMTIFLTLGLVTPGGTTLSTFIRDLFGIEFSTLKIPSAIASKIHTWATQYCLGIVVTKGYRVIEALEALNPGGSARYFGMHLEKLTTKNHESENDHRLD